MAIAYFPVLNHFIFIMKKILALIAGTVFSLNAFASYTQYTFDSGSAFSGYFVQRDDNKAIAYYDIFVGGSPYTQVDLIPKGYEARVVQANNNYSFPGPTSFTVRDTIGAYNKTLAIHFESDNDAFGYSATYTQVAYDEWNPLLHSVSVSDQNRMLQTAVDPALAALLDKNGGYYYGVLPLLPTAHVPEPASLALFAIGALGAAGAARRRSKR